MCGIIAVSGFRDVIQDLYDGLILLQHRGQDAAGIVTYDSQFHLKKSIGTVAEVFHQHSLLRLRGFDNLFVADASVMPKCPRANIHLTSVMIGERMGEWLREGAV